MKIHPRERLVTEAEQKIRAVALDAIKGLTVAEGLSAVTRALSGEILSVLKYEIRHERHGNTETPGGLASD